MNLRQAAQQAQGKTTMHPETVLALARESGLWEFFIKYTRTVAGKNAKAEDLIWSDLEYFAALVAAHEREECAKVLEAHPSYDFCRCPCECAAAIRSRT
jgi:hypothetical protein